MSIRNIVKKLKLPPPTTDTELALARAGQELSVAWIDKTPNIDELQILQEIKTLVSGVKDPMYRSRILTFINILIEEEELNG